MIDLWEAFSVIVNLACALLIFLTVCMVVIGVAWVFVPAHR